jgi:hypothetical protein
MLLQKDLCWFEVHREMWALAFAPYLGRKLGDWFMCKSTSKSGPTLIQMHPNLEGGCNTQYNMEIACQSTCMDPLKVQWCEIHCELGQFWAKWPMWSPNQEHHGMFNMFKIQCILMFIILQKDSDQFKVYRDIYTMACAPSFDWKMGCVSMNTQIGRALIQMHPNLEEGCNIHYNMEWTSYMVHVVLRKVH